MGDPVKPSADSFAVADCGGAADQDQERGLERVLDVSLVAKYAATDAQDHRPMPRDESGERRLVAAGCISLQQCALGQCRDGSAVEQAVQLVEDRA